MQQEVREFLKHHPTELVAVNGTCQPTQSVH
jgi:hypothetical protein